MSLKRKKWMRRGKTRPAKGDRKIGRKGGSVLIMVVGLLVLLALIGTAFLSTSHAERSVSIQATADARVDLLVQGVEQMAKATIASGLINPNVDPNTGSYVAGSVPATALVTVPNAFQLRPKFDEPDFSVPPVFVPNSAVPMGYGDWDMPDLQSQYTNTIGLFAAATGTLGAATQRFYAPVDSWLSPRFPQPCPYGNYTPFNAAALGIASPASFSFGGKNYPLPAWTSIGRPLIGDHFESPFVGTINLSTGAETLNSSAIFGQPLQLLYQERLDPWVSYAAKNQLFFLQGLTGIGPTPPGAQAGEFVPRFVQVPPNSGNWFPAWLLQTPLNPKTNNNSTGTAGFYLAGDADGDGVADCGMFRLPSNLDGLTWYAGVRIVDNGSAINVNTAWDRDSDYDGSAVCYPTAYSAIGPAPALGPPGPTAGYTNTGSTAFQYGQAPFTQAQGLFTSNVGLQELLHTWAFPATGFMPSSVTFSANQEAGNGVSGPAVVSEMTYLNEFRFNCDDLQHYTPGPLNFNLAVTPMGSVPPQEPVGVFSNYSSLSINGSNLNLFHPFDEYYDAPTQATVAVGAGANSSQVRPDFWYLTMGDALQSLLGRRLYNPGNLNVGTDPNANPTGSITLQAQAYGLEDAGELAYHFCLINPATIAPGLATNTYNSSSVAGTISPYGVATSSFYTGKIERDLYRSVFDTAPNSPFPPPAESNFTVPFGFENLRNSGQSQYSPSLFTDYGTGTYQAAETVYCWYRDNFEFDDEGGATLGAVGSTANPYASPPSAANPYYYQPAPESNGLGSNSATLSINFKPRRSILVTTNAVSNLMPWVDPPDYNSFNSKIPTAGSLSTAGAGTLSASLVMGYGNSGSLGVNGGPTYSINSTPNLVPKANPNTSSFGDLWRAYWGVMATEHATIAANAAFTGGTYATQSPFGGTYTINTAALSLYTGRQFPTVVQVPPDSATETPAYVSQQPLQYLPSNTITPSQTNQTTVVTQGMFCSPIRDNHLTPTAGIDQLNPDQVMLLRSALAAQNTIIMRDPLHGCVGTVGANTYYFNGALRRIIHLGATAANTKGYDAIIYGAMQNPYIVEVYVNTDNKSMTGPTYSGNPNPDGYVAIKLFNPYAFNIPLTGWALAVVDRSPGTGAENTAVTPRASIFYYFGTGPATSPPYPPTPSYTVVTPTGPPIIPANNSPASRSGGGYLVLENYNPLNPGVDGDANNRPNSVATTATVSTGYPTYSATPPTTPPLEQIDVPNLAAALLYNNTANTGYQICTKELVLLRPVVFNGAATTEYVPVDSFDFTGLPTPPQSSGKGVTYTASGNATGWHYVRPNAPGGYPVNNPATLQDIQAPSVWAGIPALGAFGTPAPNFLSGNLWRFIYPGRYDGGQDAVPLAPPLGGTPRQQGVHSETWNPTTTPPPNEPWDPNTISYGADTPPIAILGTSTSSSPANTYGTYPIAFPFRYLDDSLPSPNPVQAILSGVGSFANLAPFGAFARDADIAQVPFVGAYTLIPQGTVPVAAPATPVGFTTSNMMDFNTLSSDLTMAEDTDIADDPVPDYAQSTTGSGAGSQSGGEWNLWHEEIGRFCPIMNTGDGEGIFLTTNKTTVGTVSPVDDGSPLGGYHTPLAAGKPYWRYHWATRLFDFLSTQTPHNDFLPNVDQTAYGNPNLVVNGKALTAPTPVSNSGLPALAYQPPTGTVGGVTVGTISSSVAAQGNNAAINAEAGVGVEGKININTANWRVLSTLPWVPPGMPRDQFAMSSTVASGLTRLAPAYPDYVDDNVKLAQIICDYRDGTNYTGLNVAAVNGLAPLATGPVQLGPFRSIYDLYKIPPLYLYYTYILATHEPSPNFGDQLGPSLNYCDPYSSTDGSTLVAPSTANGAPAPTAGFFTGLPINHGFDGVRLDFEEKANMLGRLSNLITTRSDSFTVYIVVQGWKNAGSTNPLEPPQLVVQRRSAFIADRSGITALGGQVKTYNFPND
jgi:hypothetical protein